MENQIKISVIIPIYNGESHIKRCFDVLMKQDFDEPYEIIIVDDASTDKSKEIIKKFKLPNLKLYLLSSNSGPATARNLGLRKALGEYIYFQDVDDIISIKSLKTLYTTAKQHDCDFVCSDFQRVENSKNQRDGTYNYPSDMVFDNNKIIEAMLRELHDPSLGHLGLFGCNGRLIKRSIIIDNNIFFEEKLRWLEDKTFCWDVLGFVRNARYLRKQLYSYYVYPKVSTGITESLSRGFPIKWIKLITHHVKNSLKRRNLLHNEIEKLGQQGLIFFSIQILVSISRSIILGKIDYAKGKKTRKKIIKEIINDNDVSMAIKNYSPSKKESLWIPRAIAWRSSIFLEFACNRRAKEVIQMRRSGKV
jgi:glycosyltransferase involved in cell wall biosynthesis